MSIPDARQSRDERQHARGYVAVPTAAGKDALPSSWINLITAYWSILQAMFFTFLWVNTLAEYSRLL